MDLTHTIRFIPWGREARRAAAQDLKACLSAGNLRPTGVAVVIAWRRGKIRALVVTSKYNGTHGFPKGGIEKRESVAQGSRRECHEETGLFPKRLRPIAYLGTADVLSVKHIDGFDTKRYFVVLYFYDGPMRLKINKKELSAGAWMTDAEGAAAFEGLRATRPQKADTNEILLKTVYEAAIPISVYVKAIARPKRRRPKRKTP